MAFLVGFSVVLLMVWISDPVENVSDRYLDSVRSFFEKIPEKFAYTLDWSRHEIPSSESPVGSGTGDEDTQTGKNSAREDSYEEEGRFGGLKSLSQILQEEPGDEALKKEMEEEKKERLANLIKKSPGESGQLEKKLTLEDEPESSSETVGGNELLVAEPSPVVEAKISPEVSENLYAVRFAVCLLRESADVVQGNLKKKGVSSVIFETQAEMEAHRLIVGPIGSDREAEKAENQFRKKGWKPDRFTSEGNSYFSLGFFYNKREAGKVEGDLKKLGYKVRMRSKRIDRKVFKVISEKYPTVDEAQGAQKKIKTLGISSIVERLESES